VVPKYTHIIPIMEGRTFLVHNGKKNSPVRVKKSMLGKVIGEYVQTKKRCVYRRKKNKNKRKR
jgi:ribosomal protein S19